MAKRDARQSFKKNLCNLMSVRQLTQDDIAKSIGISASAISSWCKGNVLPKSTSLIKLANYFMVSPSTLLNDNSIDTMNDEERIINAFRMCSTEGKKKILEIVNDLKNEYWYDKVQ